MTIRPPRLRHRTTLLLTFAFGLSVVLAGCSSQESDPGEASGPDAVAEPVAPDTEPLTGKELPAGASADRPHPVLVVKLDNTSASSPQAGLSHADLVVEELVEGGLTRLAAFYYSQTPKVVGPVRSMRASDIGIVAPVGGQIVTSGAAAVTISRIQQAGIQFFGEGSKGVYRESTRAAPYNVFSNLATIADQTENPAGRPADYLPWGAESAFTGSRAVTTFDVSFGSGRTSQWRYDGATYVNLNSYAAADDQFPASSVLVLKADVGDAGYRDPAGNPVPETKLEGTGPAMLFHGGMLVRGRWAKDGLDGTISLTTKDGPLTVPAGQVWVELVPKTTGGVSFR